MWFFVVWLTDGRVMCAENDTRWSVGSYERHQWTFEHTARWKWRGLMCMMLSCLYTYRARFCLLIYAFQNGLADQFRAASKQYVFSLVLEWLFTNVGCKITRCSLCNKINLHTVPTPTGTNRATFTQRRVSIVTQSLTLSVRDIFHCNDCCFHH